MNKRLCVYTVILVILSVVSLFISKDNQKDVIKWFDFGNKKIVSLKYESKHLDVEIVKQDMPVSKQRLKELKGLKNRDIYFLKYINKKVDPTSKQSYETDSTLLQGSYELNVYLNFYSPLLVEKSFETDDLESFGIDESSPKITIQYEGGINKSILVGNNKYDNVRTYYYDPEKKSVLIQDNTLVRVLNDALKSLVSYKFSDVRAMDVSYMKVNSSDKEKSIYKVNTMKDSVPTPSWSLTPQGEANDYIVKWIDYLMTFKVENYLDINDNEVEKVMSISMFNDKDNIIDSVDIAKYKEGYVGKTNYTGSWVSISKEEAEKVISQFNAM